MRVSFFIIVSLGLIFGGCSSSWHIKKAMKKDPESFKRDTIINRTTIKKDTTIILDTTILVLLPRDTAKVYIPIEKLKPRSFKPIHSENGIINVDVWMTKDKLHISSYLDSTMIYELEAEIQLKDALIYSYEQQIINNEITITEQKGLIERLKSTFKWLKYVLLVVVILIIVGISYKFIKWLKK